MIKMSLHEQKGKRSAIRSITFRINAKIVNQLVQESEERRISLNTLGNQIFADHVSWHGNASKAGFLSVRKELLIKLMRKMNKEEISQLAQAVARDSTKDILLFLRQEYSITSVLDVIETWVRITGFPYRKHVNGDLYSFIIQHDMGENWSFYLAELYRTIFEDLHAPRPDFDITQDTVAFTVKGVLPSASF